MNKRVRTPLILVVAIVAVAAIALGWAVFQARDQREAASLGEKNMPTALARHMEKLQEAIPGNGGEPEEGPASAAEAEFMARAYPADTITVGQMDAARQAYTKIQGRPFPKGKGRPDTWVTAGPSQALYPATLFRNSASYVPNAYYAGGRTTAIAISATCKPGDCRVWVAPAGGGIWRARNALDGQPSWQYLAGPLGINAAGSIAIDPNDPTGNTIYVGTGEANVCGSGCVAGVGLYKSTDGGDTWTGPLGKNELGGKGLGAIVVKPGDPNTIYVGTTTALRGMSSTCCSGVTRPVPGAAKWGLYKSTDGGATWAFIHNGSANAADCVGDLNEYNNGGVCSPRGVRHVVLDPSNPDIVYAGSYARGVWRSNDAGATWTQIKPSLNAAVITTRPGIAVTALPNGKTRMYVYEGNTGSPYARLFRSDDVATGAPVFQDLTSSNRANDGYGTYNQCTGQCWYDLIVYTPKGYPDIVYTGGSYSYNETGGVSNGRGLMLSTDAGVSSTDMTMDGTDPIHPNGLHPDQHDMVTNPNNPFQFFETSDGGVVRSSGDFSNVSSWCDSRGLTGTRLSRCYQLLSRVPSKLESMNKGLSTLQFMSLSVSPHNVNVVQGGTQDNGTWQTPGNPIQWENTMIGDGGQSGFDIANPDFRFHTFYDASPDVNFSGGDIADWNWIADPIYGQANTQFYAPMISDPAVSGTLFVGTGRTVYRTKTFGMGSMTLDEFRQHCNEWTGDFTVQCGDWEELGPTLLTDAAWGDRAGGAVAAVERTAADSATLWAATTTGRVFISKNADADPAGAVSFTRLDSLVTNDPDRFISGIYVDPADANHAWISYSGFDANTPATPGHVFDVSYDPGAGTATWTDVSFDLGDQAITDVVRDDVTGDLYISSDFGVFRLANGTASWTLAAPGMPNVEVPGLTIIPAQRKLYAATHGLSAWLLNLP
jgi:hypothetical protein